MEIKTVVAALGIFAGGVVVGWAVTADYYERRLIESERRVGILEEKFDHFEARLQDIQTERQMEMTIPPPPSMATTWEAPDLEQPELDLHLGAENAPEDVSGDEDVIYETIEEAETAVVREGLQKIIDQYTGDPDEIKHSIYAANQTLVPNNTPPYVISKAEFAYDEEGDGYDKITVNYYPGHKLLLDEDGSSIQDVNGTVGWKNLTKFGQNSDDEDIVFIRNHRLLSDFEVIREDEQARLPIWIKYGMGKEEFEVRRAAGLIRVRDEDL